MAREARLTIVAGRLGRLGVLLVAISGMHTARGASSDLSGFLGVWTFQEGSRATASCSSPDAGGTWALAGTRISIYPGTKTGTDLTFDIGCHCTIGLNVDGSTATLTAPQNCSLVNQNEQVSGPIDEVTLQRSDSGVLSWTFSGAGAQLLNLNGGCSLSSFSGMGTLTRTGSEPIDCGDPNTAVGVRTIPGKTGAACPMGAGREGLWIYMHDEDDPGCSDATGSRGEGGWVLPDDEGSREPVCGASHGTNMDFCRVDGARLKPLTTETDQAQFYAVLKLGTTCPKGSVAIQKSIDNEDQPKIDPVNGPSRAIGDLGPDNEVNSEALGTVTKLTFCFFRAAESPDETMPAFPDFGLPYAVFHRFTGEQPPWVIAKRWQHSQDEIQQNRLNGYGIAPSAIRSEFEEVIENSGYDTTTFNMARVR